MKYIIFDAGPIISLTMNGLLPVLERLRGVFDGKFIVTPQVKREIIDRPIKIKKYELEGLKVKDLLDRGILTISTELIPNQRLERETRRIMKITNSIIRDSTTGEKINLIHEGEASCLALSNICKCDNIIVVDERSTRMLVEAPEKLVKLMERKLHTTLRIDSVIQKNLKNFRFIRSSELLYVGYKKDLIGLKKDKTLLDALMYGVKAKGAAISSREIEEMKKLV
jgi:predicted nucleic acid-binding protein